MWRFVVERTKNGEFNWVDLSAGDFEGQSAFYEALFGWVPTDMPLGEGAVYRMFKAEGHTVAGMSKLSPEQAKMGWPSAWNIYVTVDDMDATVAKASELGATVVMPPADVPGDSGRIAGIKDPTGAYVFFWKPRQPDESMEYMIPGTLAWSELNTRDPEGAIEFYTKLLGWDVQPLPAGAMPYWTINVDGQGEGGIMPVPDMVPAEVPGYWLPYFATADLDATVVKAQGLGARLLAGPTVVPDMVAYAVLADPIGATFAVMKPVPPAE
jgi:uncharacterized protein